MGFSSELCAGPTFALKRARNQISHRAKTAVSVIELVHNFSSKKTSKNLHVRGHACCLDHGRCMCSYSVLSKAEKRRLSQLSGYEERTVW